MDRGPGRSTQPMDVPQRPPEPPGPTPEPRLGHDLRGRSMANATRHTGGPRSPVRAAHLLPGGHRRPRRRAIPGGHARRIRQLGPQRPRRPGAGRAAPRLQQGRAPRGGRPREPCADRAQIPRMRPRCAATSPWTATRLSPPSRPSRRRSRCSESPAPHAPSPADPTPVLARWSRGAKVQRKPPRSTPKPLGASKGAAVPTSSHRWAKPIGVVALVSSTLHLLSDVIGRSGPTLFIVARVADQRNERKFVRAGADRVVNPCDIGGSRMGALAFQPHVAEFLDEVLENEIRDVDLREVPVKPGSPTAGAAVGRVTHGEDHALVIAVRSIWSASTPTPPTGSGGWRTRVSPTSSSASASGEGEGGREREARAFSRDRVRGR